MKKTVTQIFETTEENYKKLKKLGEGAFGKAFLVKCASNGALAVIKQINLASMEHSEKQKAYQEAQILR